VAQPHSSAFVVMLVAVLAGGMIGLLVLNTAMQRSAFELEGLRDRVAALDVRSQVLDLQVERLRSPDRLAREASELGMVPVTSPGFVNLDDGTVLGQPAAAVAGTGPELVRVPPAPDIAEPTRTPAPAGAPRERDTPRQDRVQGRDTPQNGPRETHRSAGRDEGGRR